MTSEVVTSLMAKISGHKMRAQRGYFLFSSGIVLAVTGIAKLVTAAFGTAKVLGLPDPVFGIPFGYLFLSVGLLELGVAFACFFGRDVSFATLLVAWLATGLLVYRLGLLFLGWHAPCRCLGGLTDALHISAQAGDTIGKVVLAFLILGSYGKLGTAFYLRGKQGVHLQAT